VKAPSLLRVERRPTPSGWTVFLVSVLAIAAALAVAAGLFQVYGVSPLRAYQLILQGALGSPLGLAEIVRRAIPLLLCGVGLTVAFRAVFWNIGAEGQLLLGAVAATGVGLFSGLPDALLLPAMFLAGFLAGAAWGLIPAALKAKLGLNDVITTLMMNYVAAFLVEWLIHGPWKGTQMRGFAYTDKLPDAARLALIPGTRIHWLTLVLGLALALLAYVLVTRTRVGFEIRVVGENAFNLQLGKKRADAVMDYFYKKHHIPLHRMEVISFGSSVPVADNGTRDGRALNRRVEILVYE